MPSPLGHALGGVISGWLVGGAAVSSHDRRAVVRSAVGFGILGLLADFDFLFGTHSTYSHSIGAAAVVFVLALAWLGTRRATAGGPLVVAALAASAAYASHILLDWLGTDGAPPFGIMALWPFSNEFYLSGMGVFPPVERRFWLPDFWLRTSRMLVVEITVLGGALALVTWARRRRTT